MKTVKKMAAQGDVIFRKIKALPKGVKKRDVTGPIIVAHSETGHHHSIDCMGGVTIHDDPSNPLVCYLMLDGVDHADVVHHRSFDTHEMLRLLGIGSGKQTVFEVRRQREYTPEGWRRVED